MNHLTYNASLAAGLLCASVGAGLQWGAPIGLMVAGAIILAATVVTAKVIA